MRVAILGCGPAGLLAAHAARLSGHEVTIYSRKIESPMRGAQYMHKFIPELHMYPPQKLEYLLDGTIQAYRDKIYGDIERADDIAVSPQLFVGTHECWSIRFVYTQLWHQFKDSIIDAWVDSNLLQRIASEYDHILSTIPATQLCYQKDVHVFNAVQVWIDNQWSGPIARPGQNIVLCNGIPFVEDRPLRTGWYRTSLIYGHSNTEWIINADVPRARQAALVTKPINTNCDCWPNIVRAGRYGRWRKGVLSHEAFDLALEVLR